MNYAQPSGIAAAAAERLAKSDAVLVGIDGLGGSGKTHFAGVLETELVRSRVPVSTVHMDDFFLPLALRPRGLPSTKPVGSDFDWRRLRDQVVHPLRGGRHARYDQYDWNEDRLTGALEVAPGRVVLIEGVYVCRRELAPLYDLRVWVECPRDVRLQRGLERDGEAARARWEQDWMPCEDRYMEEHRPLDYVEAIVSGVAS